MVCYPAQLIEKPLQVNGALGATSGGSSGRAAGGAHHFGGPGHELDPGTEGAASGLRSTLSSGEVPNAPNLPRRALRNASWVPRPRNMGLEWPGGHVVPGATRASPSWLGMRAPVFFSPFPLSSLSAQNFSLPKALPKGIRLAGPSRPSPPLTPATKTKTRVCSAPYDPRYPSQLSTAAPDTSSDRPSVSSRPTRFPN